MSSEACGKDIKVFGPDINVLCGIRDQMEKENHSTRRGKACIGTLRTEHCVTESTRRTHVFNFQKTRSGLMVQVQSASSTRDAPSGHQICMA